MESDSTVPRFAVGLNRSLKLIRAKRVKKIFLASDVDDDFHDRVKKESDAANLCIDESYNSLSLAKKFGIDVPCGIVTYYE